MVHCTVDVVVGIDAFANLWWGFDFVILRLVLNPYLVRLVGSSLVTIFTTEWGIMVDALSDFGHL